MNIKNIENNVYVYEHIRLDKNEVFYVGIGNKSNFKRAFQEPNRSTFWKNIVSKSNGFKVNILFKNLSWDEACLKEIKLIALYGRKDLGLGTLVNLTNGGDGKVGIKCTQETRDKISKANKGKNRSIEAKNKISLSQIGKRVGALNHFYGKPSPFKDKHHTEETKEKLRILAKQRTVSKEVIEKMIEGRKKLCYKILNTETGVIYEGIKFAAKSINMKYATLSCQLRGVYKNKTNLKIINSL